MTQTQHPDTLRAQIEAFVAHLERRPGSLAFGSGKTLKPELLRALLSRLDRYEKALIKLADVADALGDVCNCSMADEAVAEARTALRKASDHG